MISSAGTSLDGGDVVAKDVSCGTALRAKARRCVSRLVLCRCGRLQHKTSAQVIPYDNTRDQDVSLRQLYGQDDEPDNIKVTWVADQAESSISDLTAPSPDDRAEEGKIAALSPREASTTLPQTGGLAQLHAINKLDLTNLQPPEVEQHAANVGLLALHDNSLYGSAQEAIDALQHDKALLEEEISDLHRQLTWLQTHSSLQDNINQDLTAEVLHLREALAALSAHPATA